MFSKTKNTIRQTLTSIALISAMLFGQIAITSIPTVLAQTKPTENFEVFEVLVLPGQEKQDPRFVKEANEMNVYPIVAFIIEIINYAMIILGSFAFLIMVAGSIIIMTSGGNDQRNEQGKNMLTYSILGMVVAFSAFIIATFVQSLVSGT